MWMRAAPSALLSNETRNAPSAAAALPVAGSSQLVRSITERLWPLGDEVMFLPGHGRLSTFGQEREDNPFVSDIAVATGVGPPDPEKALGPAFD